MLKLAATLFLLAPITDDLATLQSAFQQAETARARVVFLDRIAVLHTNLNSAEVTLAVAAGLEDEEMLVRARAATLLASGVHIETAVNALTGGMPDLLASEVRVMRQMERSLSEPIPLGDLAKLKRHNERMEEAADGLKHLRSYEDAIITSIGGYRDDRCVKALGEHLQKSRFRRDDILETLLKFGTAPALSHALIFVERQEDALARRKKARSKLARKRPEKQPKSWRGTREDWKDSQRKSLEASLRAFDRKSKQIDAEGANLLERLQTFALDRALESPPSKLEHGAWKKWLKEVRHLLPESLNG